MFYSVLCVLACGPGFSDKSESLLRLMVVYAVPSPTTLSKTLLHAKGALYFVPLCLVFNFVLLLFFLKKFAGKESEQN